MTFKEKLKSYNFWISLVSALILILNILNLKEKMPSKSIGIAISRTHLPNFSTKKLLEMIIKSTNSQND